MNRTLAALALIGVCATTGALAQTPIQNLEQVRKDFAQTVYQNSSADINRGAPQALLRAVVVLQVRLAEDGHWLASVIRENDQQPELTRKALASVANLPVPANLPEALAAQLRREGFMEAWLFQNDAHFALKTLALPQRSF